LRGDKNGFVDTSKLFRRPQNEQHKAPSPLAPGGGFCWASGTMTGEGASFAGGWRHAIRPRLPALLAQCDRSGVLTCSSGVGRGQAFPRRAIIDDRFSELVGVPRALGGSFDAL
jgi:hypothetical protein